MAQDRDNFKLLYQQALANITPGDDVTSEVKHFQVECDNLRERLLQESAHAEQVGCVGVVTSGCGHELFSTLFSYCV